MHVLPNHLLVSLCHLPGSLPAAAAKMVLLASCVTRFQPKVFPQRAGHAQTFPHTAWRRICKGVGIQPCFGSQVRARAFRRVSFGWGCEGEGSMTFPSGATCKEESLSRRFSCSSSLLWQSWNGHFLGWAGKQSLTRRHHHSFLPQPSNEPAEDFQVAPLSNLRKSIRGWRVRRHVRKSCLRSRRFRFYFLASILRPFFGTILRSQNGVRLGATGLWKHRCPSGMRNQPPEIAEHVRVTGYEALFNVLVIRSFARKPGQVLVCAPHPSVMEGIWPTPDSHCLG